MSAPSTHGPLTIVALLLREPERLLGEQLDEHAAGDRLAQLGPSLLAITVAGAALFGVVLGSYRGGLQLVYAALKTPLLLLLPVLVGLPAVRAFHRACEIQLSWSALALTSLVAMARTAVLAAACGPVLWLYLSLHPDYHRAILAMVAALCLVASPGLLFLLRSVPDTGRNQPLAAVASAAVLGLRLAQSGWLLRPFIVRPTAEIAFSRPIEADVFSSLASTRRSASGNYRGWDAPAAGLLGRRHASSDELLETEAAPDIQHEAQPEPLRETKP